MVDDLVARLARQIVRRRDLSEDLEVEGRCVTQRTARLDQPIGRDVDGREVDASSRFEGCARYERLQDVDDGGGIQLPKTL